VTRHARASTAASISTRGAGTRPAKADAIRVASSDAKGTGAPSAPMRLALALIAASCVFAVLATNASAAAPTVTIEPASSVGYTTALAKGSVDPADHATGYRFDYITEAHFQENLTNSLPGFQGAGSAGPGNLSEGAGETAVEPTLKGLAPNTTYHLRLFAENDQGEHVEAIAATFTTKATTPPALAVKAPEASFIKAHLAATINPEGGNVNTIGGPVPITWELQFSHEPTSEGWKLAGGDEIKEAKAEAGTAIEVEAQATGLAPVTHYVTRLVVKYAGIETIAAEEPGFETLAVAKPTVTINPITTFSAHTAQLIGHINPNSPEAEGSTSAAEEEAFKTTYHFQCKPECLGPGIEGEVLADKSPHEVPAEAIGLTPGLLYHVELIAANAGGKETAGPITFTTEAEPPTIDSTFATAVSETEATLGAKVNPGGASTTTHFDYITDEEFKVDGNSFGAGTEKTLESTPIGSGVEDQPAEAEAIGLEADTVYRYRVVATNAKSPSGTPGPAKAFHTTAAASGFSGCPNEAVRRQNNSTGLADCRAYEMVSPVDKGGYAAYPEEGNLPAQVSTSGDALAYRSLGAFPGAQGSTAAESAHVGTRTSEGWQNSEWTPPAPNPKPIRAYIIDYAFSADLTEAILRVPLTPLTPDATPYMRNLFHRDPEGAYSLVNANPPTLTPEDLCEPESLLDCWLFGYDNSAFAGASGDFSQVLFESNAQFTNNAPETGIESLYENSGGAVRLVGILPDGIPAASSTAGGGSSAGYSSSFKTADRSVERATSEDGSKVVFQAPSDEGEKPAEEGQGGMTEVYDRIDGTETIEISAPNSGASPENPAAGPASFQSASTDGSRVFFTSAAELTTQSKTGNEGGEDLYEYDFAKPAGQRLTDLSIDAAPGGARVQGVIDAATDGSYLYLVALGRLDGAKGTDGQPNLYTIHDGEAPAFIATLGSEGECEFIADPCVWSPFPAEREAYVAPDGRHMAFMSTQSLATVNFPEGYDNTDQKTGEADSEVYEWSAESGELLCASCDPSGRRPLNKAAIASIFPSGGGHGGKANYSPVSTSFYKVRVLSENGRRLFYEAPDPHTGTYKVFEYEAEGEGSCARAGGCQYLISDPGGEENEQFLGASPDGRDVFLATSSRLVPGDEDNLRDVFDARAGGGFAVTPPTPPCEGEGCRGPGSSRPASAPAGSSQFAGPEEGPRHPRCAKHQVKRHGGCVSRKQKSKHQRRSHKRAANNNRRASR
jgi:hypothetical protein